MDAALHGGAWEAAVDAHLRRVVPQIVPGAVRVEDLEVLAPDVWLIHLQGRGRVVAKHQLYGVLTRDEPYDLLQVEYDVLRALRRTGDAVPVVFGIEPEGQFIFLEYVGPRTLADVLQTDEPDWIGRVVAAQWRLEQTLAADHHWQDRVIRGARATDLQRAWADVEAVALRGLSRWAAAHGRPDLPQALRPIIRALHAKLGARTPNLGAVDYQPGNVVCAGSGKRLAFLELAKLGWDWTERRALQYTTPLGDVAGSARIRVARLHELAAAMPCQASRQALDSHHLFFRLLMAARDPASVSPDILSQPLSDEPSMQDLRHHLAASAL